MSSTEADGCGCSSICWLILSFLFLWSIIFGLPTPWGFLDIDLFPPKIKLEAKT